MKSQLQLVVEDLGQRYGDLVLFTGLHFSVPAGRGLVVTGENGSGKSTLLRTIGGLQPAAEGRIRLEGGDDERSIAEQCHHVSFANAIKPELTVTENLVQWRDILDAPLGAAGQPALAIDEALERLGLGAFAHTRVGILSTGLRRRAALARVLVVQRPLWLLDEPTAALDLASSRLVATMIKEHLAAGGLAVIATHLDLGVEGLDSLDLAPLATGRPAATAS